MAPITCRVQGSHQEPLAGLYVILECFEGHVDTFDAFTSSDGVINSWLPFTGPRTSPGDDVPVDSQNYSTCRMSFSSESAGHDLSLWPLVQVDLHLRPDSCHGVLLHYTFSGYRVEIESAPEDQFLLEDEVFEAADLVDPKSDATYQPDKLEELSWQDNPLLELPLLGSPEKEISWQDNLDEEPSLQLGASADASTVPPSDAGRPLPKKRGRPRKAASEKTRPQGAAKPPLISEKGKEPAGQDAGVKRKRGRPRKKARAV